MKYTLYLKPLFAKSKKAKQNRVKTRRNDFVETYFLNTRPSDNFEARGGRDI